YKKDLPGSDQWFEANKELFLYLSDIVLRNLNPRMYDKFKSIVPYLDPESNLHPLCGAWHGCAINQNQTSDGKPHIDGNDYHFGLNVVTGWGNFTSSKLLLWQLGLAIEIVPGDAILFLGRLFTHNAIDIQGGSRNIVDAFTHLTTLTWVDRKGKHEKAERDKKIKAKQELQEDLELMEIDDLDVEDADYSSNKSFTEEEDILYERFLMEILNW
ncbi:MAG: hypothetical protein M4579_007079, partial [Chaenotheca gracillima]